MAGNFNRVQAMASSDDELLQECKELAQCTRCDSITWSEPGKGNRIDPPPNTMAVVVDLTSGRGAMRIYDKTGPYVNGIGMEDEGKRMIVPWYDGWWFYVSGNLKVGLVFGARD
ncbi:hypothetical protein V6Z98_001668 [Aspergillus fumigatus]